MTSRVAGKTGPFPKWKLRLVILLLGSSILGGALALRLTIYHRYYTGQLACFDGDEVQFNGHAVDVCAYRTSTQGGYDCGQVPADIICQQKGYLWAYNWTQAMPEPNTTAMTISNSVVGEALQVISSVCCDNKSYWPSPPRWMLWSSGVILMYLVSVLITKLIFLVVEIIFVSLVATEALYFFSGIDAVFAQVIYTVGVVVWTYQCFWVLWCESETRECYFKWRKWPHTLLKISQCLMACQLGRLTACLLGKAFGWAYFFRNQLPQLKRVVKQERTLRYMINPRWAEALISAQDDTSSDASLGRATHTYNNLMFDNNDSPTNARPSQPHTNHAFEHNNSSQQCFKVSLFPSWQAHHHAEHRYQPQPPQPPPLPSMPAPTAAVLRGDSLPMRPSLPPGPRSPSLPDIPEMCESPLSVRSTAGMPAVTADFSLAPRDSEVVPLGSGTKSPPGTSSSWAVPVGNIPSASGNHHRDPGFENSLLTKKHLEAHDEKFKAKQVVGELHSDLVALDTGIGSFKRFREFLHKYQNMTDKRMEAEVKDLATRLIRNLKSGIARSSRENIMRQGSYQRSLSEGEVGTLSCDEECIMFTDFVNALQRAGRKVPGLSIKRSSSAVIETATKAWQMFDKEDSKQLKFEDVHLTLEEVYKQRRNLAHSIHANEAVSNSIKATINGVIQTTLLFVYLAIFGIGWMTFGLGLSYFKVYIIVVSFLFRDYFRTVFNNIIYLLGEHPYDVGDELEFQKNTEKERKWVVQSFDLMYTVLMSKDGGDWVCVANNYLSTSHPINRSRTKRRKEKFKITVPADMPMDVVPKVIEAMTKLYNEKFKEDMAPKGGIRVRISDMPDSQTLILTCKFRYSNPPPDESRCKKIKKAMKELVIATLLELNVHGIPLNLDWGMVKLVNGKQA